MSLKKRTKTRATVPQSIARPARYTKQRVKSRPQVVPTQWGRRLARLVGEKLGVTMSANLSHNEGTYRGRVVAIKCAKSWVPPVTVLLEMLERVDEVWAVYLAPDDSAEVWAVKVGAVREHGYFTRGPNVQKRVELYRRKAVRIGRLIGTLTPDEVESCHIP